LDNSASLNATFQMRIAMSARYFCETPICGETATLSAGEAHHLSRVMRASVGDAVVLFDGSGAEFTSRIERIAKSSVELSLIERREIDRELPFRLTLAVALPKGDRQRWLVEKAVELGVTRLVPLATTRGVADGRAAIERLRRAVIEASKQCGRNRLMEIAPPQHWRDISCATSGADSVRLFAHPTSGAAGCARPDLELARGRDATIAIGPEGGWTDEEAAIAREDGWRFVDLGTRILRVETAAIALASVVAMRQAT
jgi:16S rRNA (uracil1498-N3)-methyltransferase